jgi:hypothetical protein
MLTRMMSVALAILTLYCAHPAAAQSTEDALPAARELMAVMRLTEMFKATLPPMLQQMKESMTQGRPQLERDFDVILPTLIETMSEHVGEFSEMLAALYARNFTADELHTMTAFYNSAAGQKYMSKLPLIMQGHLVIAQSLAQKLTSEFQSRMAEELRKKGHKI